MAYEEPREMEQGGIVMEELQYQKSEAMAKMTRCRTLLIIAAALTVLLAAAAGYLTYLIGDGQVKTDAVVIPQEEYAAYAPDAEPGTYVQAEVTELRSVFGVSRAMYRGTGRATIPEISTYVEMTRTDGSICLLTFDGDADEVLETWIPHANARMQAAYGEGAYAAPLQVYGRVTLVTPVSGLADTAHLESADSNVFPFKPTGMTDADYWRSLEKIAVIDLDKADWTKQVQNEEHASQLSLWQSARTLSAGAAAVALAAGVIALIGYKKANKQFIRLVMQAKRSA